MEHQVRERTDADAELPGTLCCTLLDRRSSAPLNGARITCVGRDSRVARFDADRYGRFTTTLDQGVYDLVISARGYLSLLVRGVGVLAGHNQNLIRALVPGQGEDTERQPATAVGGYITDRFGRPVSNVTMNLTAERGDVTFTTRTDRDGAYLLHGVLPNSYDLSVSLLERRILRENVPVPNAKEFVRLDFRIVQL